MVSLLCFPVHATTTETLYPNAVGDSSACTPVGGSGPNWDCVDETPHDSDTTRVGSVADEEPYLDLYNIGPTAIPVGSTINSVTVYAVCRSLSNTWKAYFRIALKKSGGTTQYGTEFQPTTTYTLSNKAFTGIAQTDLDALQIGIEICSYTTYNGRCTQVYVVIDYTVAQQGTSLTLNGAITATFSLLSQKTMAFTKYPSITETFSLQHAKSISFSRSALITLTTVIGSLMSYTTRPLLNLFGIIPITFSTDNSKTVSFYKQSVLTLTTTIESFISKTRNLNLFGLVPFTFSLDNSKTFSFLRESVLTLTASIDGTMSYTRSGTILHLFGIIPVTFTPNSIRSWIFETFPSITFTFTIIQANTLPTPATTPTTPTGKGGNAPAIFGLSQPQKVAVAFVLLAACIVVAVKANQKVRRKKGLGKARHDTEQSGRKPRLEANAYDGSRPLGVGVKGEEYSGKRPLGVGKKGKWKHPRPKKKR